jgi:ECF transporter S component (folate family)
MQKSRFSPRAIVLIGMLTALNIVLSRFLSISVWNMKLGLGFIPVLLCAMMLGPLSAGLVGGLGDFLGAILFPIGAYFPGFTLTAFLMGMVFGLLLHKRRTLPRMALAAAINQLGLSLLLNTLWISLLYSSPYLPLLVTRLAQSAVMLPLQFVAALGMERILHLVGKRALA